MRLLTTLPLLVAAICVPLGGAMAESPKMKAYKAMRGYCQTIETGAAIDLAEVEVRPYTVRRGEALGTIAQQRSVDGTSSICLAALNEAVLSDGYVNRCKAVSVRAGRFYCNDALGNDNFPAWTNSLQPGDQIMVFATIPDQANEIVASDTVSGEVAHDINVAVREITGSKVVVVIDGSGSMNNDSDRAAAAGLYSNLLGDRVAAVVVFSEETAVITSPNADTFPNIGNTDVGYGQNEYVEKALRVAASLEADHIVLIGDEPDYDRNANYIGLPSVTTHCLPNEGGQRECDANYRHIAVTTSGQIAWTE